jgi:TolB protein
MKHLLKFSLVVILSAFGLFAGGIRAGADDGQVLIKVGDAKVKKSLIALPPLKFLGKTTLTPSHKTLGSQLFNVLLNDLDVSNYFEFIKQDAFLEDTSEVGLRPAPQETGGFKYENWKKIGADFLVRAGFQVVKDELILTGYLYQISQAKTLLDKEYKEYKGNQDNYRDLAHRFSNDIVKALTGQQGIFRSRIAVASDKEGKDWKEIFVMDWDAYNSRRITSHKSITLSPAWSPDGKTIVYTAYAYHAKAKTRNADLFSYELDTGKRFLLSSRPGINSGACYHPDGKSIYLTVSQGGNPDIFKIKEDGENPIRITNGPLGAMNVEPAIRPDGNKIAFSSDRSGQPMIYTMDMDASNVKRITFAGRYNASPVWSPDGKKLAFAGFDKDHFDVFIMNPDGTTLERLTAANKKNGKPSNNEDPTFSPDGRHIMFISDRTGSKQIYIVNVDGSNERRITTDTANYFRPKWLHKVD